MLVFQSKHENFVTCSDCRPGVVAMISFQCRIVLKRGIYEYILLDIYIYIQSSPNRWNSFFNHHEISRDLFFHLFGDNYIHIMLYIYNCIPTSPNLTELFSKQIPDILYLQLSLRQVTSLTGYIGGHIVSQAGNCSARKHPHLCRSITIVELVRRGLPLSQGFWGLPQH